MSGTAARSRLLLALVVLGAAGAGAAWVVRARSGGPAIAAAPRITLRAATAGAPAGVDRLLPGDIDGDGRADFLQVSLPEPQMWFSRGDGSFDVVPFPWSGPRVPVVQGTLDGDPRGDFLFATGEGNLLTLVRGFSFIKPTGHFPMDPKALPAGTASDGTPLLRQEGVFYDVQYRHGHGVAHPDDGGALLVGDVDGDRQADLVSQRPAAVPPPPAAERARRLGGAIPWPRFYDPRRGHFAGPREAAGAPLAPDNRSEPATLQFILDVAAEQPRRLRATDAALLDEGCARLTGGDFNGDGRLDFVRQPRGPCADDGDEALLYQSEGEGFRVDRIVAVPAAQGPAQEVQRALRAEQVRLIAGDFDGDRKTDLLCQRLDAGAPGLPRVTVWLARGEGRFVVVEFDGSEADRALWQRPGVQLTAADVDGDGRADLVVTEAAGVPARVLLSGAGVSAGAGSAAP